MNNYRSYIRENLIERNKILDIASEDSEFRAIIKEKCKRDIVFFVNMFCFTYDPRKDVKHIPFILYNFQERLIRWIEERREKKEDGLIEKSRDMGVTWTGLAYIIHHWLFESGFSAHIGSRKEEYVDRNGDFNSLFERMRYILRKLPKWILPKGFHWRTHSSYMKLINSEKESIITGESTNDDFGRQARASICWLDEFATWQHSESAWSAVSEVTPTKIVVSTPKGKLNTFARLRFESNISVFTLHWREHPEKTEEWYQKIIKDKIMTQQQIAQELDIDYTSSAGKPVYSDFRKDRHTGEFLVNPNKPIYRGWDFGYHHPAVVFAQFDDEDRLIVFDEILGEDVILEVFAKEVLSRYSVHKGSFYDYCDPAGAQKSDKNVKTSIEILQGIGIYPSWRASEIEEGLTLIRKMMIEDRNGKPAIMIDKKCRILIDGFLGGYHYPEKQEGKPEKELPEKDGYYEHLMDALRYLIVNTKMMYPARKIIQPPKREGWGNIGY